QRRWRCARLQRALAQLQNKLVDLIVLELGDGIFKHEFLGQHAHRKAQVLTGVPCVEVLQGLLALAHVGTGRHWLTPMRKDVLEDAASQFVACTAGSSGMTRLETFPTHLTPFVPVAVRAPLPRLASEMLRPPLSSANWCCRSRISARRATSDREMPSMAACSSAHAYRSGLTRTAITGCSCASFSDIGVALRSYKRCLSYKCILHAQSTERNEKPRRGGRRGSGASGPRMFIAALRPLPGIFCCAAAKARAFRWSQRDRRARQCARARGGCDRCGTWLASDASSVKSPTSTPH